MTKELPPPQTTPLPLPAPEPAAKSLGSRPLLRLHRLVVAAWKFLFGVALTQTLLGSIVIAGWTMRAAQRTARRAWWKQAGRGSELDFRDFARDTTFQRGLATWPNWLLEQNGAWKRAHRAPGFVGKARAIFRALFLSAGLNLKIGAQATVNTWALTLPGCVLMLFSWYAGWHNSFNKGYEQAAVGPVTGFAGIFLFIAAMFYVPMAQMRQASTGNWKSFYQFRVVWELIRQRWLMCAGLAMLYTLFAVPVTILKSVPEFFPQINPALAELPPAEALQFAKTYYFYAGFYVLGAYVLLRILAARVYASALVECLRAGALPQETLAESEREILDRLGLLKVKARTERHFLVRTIAWLGTKVGRAATGVVVFLLWFSFVAQIYVSEFIMKSPAGRGWLNQPLVQLPWFNYIPKALQDAGAAANPPAD